MPSPSARELTANLRWIPRMYAGQGTLFWLPVFVLWFSETLGPAGVLQLEAVYYAGIVLFEVPSGWLSDRLGRRWTLVGSGLGWAFGALFVALGSSFAVFAVGQLLFAIGRSFASGTDSSVLFETLRALDREDELSEQLGLAVSRNFAWLAIGSLVGGALGGIDLRIPYLLSMLGGFLAAYAAFRLVEPPRVASDDVAMGPAIRHAASLSRVRQVFAVSVVFVLLVHIPYELMQPWLDVVLPTGWTAPVSGLAVAMGFALASASSSRTSAALAWVAPGRARLGFDRLVVVMMAVLGVVMAGMAALPYAWMVPLVMLRSLPTGLMGALVDGELHPLLPSGVRATWLSVQSLAGRLAFAVALMGMSTLTGDVWDLATLQAVLVPAAVAAFVFATFWATGALRHREG